MENATKAVRLNYVRQRNVKVILDFLFFKPYSCLELAELTNLSSAAINKILKQLISLGIIKKVSKSSGRKSVGGQHIRYEISGKAGALICVDFTHFKDHAVIYDLSGKELFRKNYTYAYEDSIIFENDIMMIVAELKAEVDKLNLDVYCVSLCVPGQIDSETNKFIISGKFNNIKDDFTYRIFKDTFNCRVIIKNNVHMMAIGEYTYGNLKSKYNSSIYIYAGYGLAACTLFKGEIMSGWKGYSGEIGGNRFSANTSLSLQCSLMRILNRLEDQLERKDVACLIESFKTNEYVYNDVINSAKILAAEIVNMTNITGADVIVISGESLQFGDDYIRTISDYLHKYCIPEMKVFPAILPDAAIKGGLELGRIHTFEQILDLKANNNC
ncbi:MAG: ROK family transcriptional regulator [Bacilli bacterium]|nr:ROK family transcriptional regulator [Bacilli bacterium]